MRKLFKIEKYPYNNFDLPEIVQNEKALLFYDFPLVYVGENKYGNIVIGYWVGYDEEDDIERYYHVIVSPDTYSKYEKKEITLLDIFKTHTIYIMDYKPDGSYSVYIASIDDIPDLYLPTDESYFPGEEVQSDKFTAKIDTPNKFIDVDSAADLIKNLKNPFQNAAKTLYPGYTTNIYIAGPYAGSFIIEYFIKTEPPSEELFPSNLKEFLTEALAEYIKLIADDKLILSFPNLPQVDHWIEYIKTNKSAPFLHYLEPLMQNDKAQEIIKRFLSYLEKSVISLQELSSNIPENQKLRIHRGDPLLSSPLMELTRSHTETFDYIYQTVLAKTGKEISEQEGTFKILIYHLNILSRIGNAYIVNPIEKNKMDRPRIKILGDSELTGSIFTKSLHESIWIEVNGKAKLEGNKYTYIEIYP